MKIFLRGALAAAWAVVAAVFSAGEAWARNECGALSSGAATCSNQAYANGIRYDLTDPLSGGVAGNVTLTVTGGAATTITSAAPASSNSWGSGIVVRTVAQGSSDQTSRNIGLNVASGANAGNAVAIAQRSGVSLFGTYDNTGVVIHQQGGRSDTTMVNLGSAVTIGSATTAMGDKGVHLLAERATNTGAQTLVSAATIHSSTYGVFMDLRGSGNVAVTNSGTINSAWQGIRLRDVSHTLGTSSSMGNLAGAARLTSTTTTVTNSGPITVTTNNRWQQGIRVDANGLGRYRIVHSGTGTNRIATSGRDGDGLYINAWWHRGHAANDDIQVESSGDITVTGQGAAGIHIVTRTDLAGTRYTDSSGTSVQQNYDSSGDIEVVTTGGAITASGTGGDGIRVIHDVANYEETDGDPATTTSTTAGIDNAAAIAANRYGIAMDTRSPGDATVTNSGSVETAVTTGAGAGIRVWDGSHNPTAGTPVIGGARRTASTTIKVTNSGAVSGKVDGANIAAGHGIWVAAYGPGLFEIVHGVAAEDTVEGSIVVPGADARGIFVDADYHSGAADSLAVKVTSSGAITASGENGIGIYVRNRAIDGHTVGDVADADLGGRIEVTNSGAITATQYAIALDSAGPGAVTVTNSGVVEVTATTGAGAGIRIWDGSHNPTADPPVIGGVGRTADTTVKVTNSGAVSGKVDGANIAAGHGIWVDAYGPGRFEIVHGVAADDAVEGSIVVPGADAHGIFVDADYHSGAADSLAVKVTSSAPITASGANGIGIFVRNRAIDGHTVDGDADADLGGRIEVTNSGAITAKRYAIFVENTGPGAVVVANEGRISATDGGVYALAARASAAGATRAADPQPVIDITWTGGFTPPTGEATVPQANGLGRALALNREAAATAMLPRASSGAGIVAEVMSWRTASSHVATADTPTIADAAAATAILAATASDAANYALRTAILAEIGEALAGDAYTVSGVDTDAIDADSDDTLSADEIATWLGTQTDRHTIMTDALRYAFTEEEAAVFRALADGDDPKAALDALETALGGTLPAGYRDRVTAIAGYRNIGDIRIAVNGGSIVSESDGVRALYAWPNDANGKIDLTIAEGAEVTGAVAGVYVARAGMGSDGILNQHVTVDGTVTGGTDAAVHLVGGGRLTVGRTGRVLAGSSGRAVLVNDPGPAEITVNGLVRGGEGARAAIHLTGGGTVTVGPAGKVEANGAARAIRGDPAPVATRVRVQLDRETYEGPRNRLNRRDAQAMFNERVAGGVTTPGGNVQFFTVGEDGMINGPQRGVPVLPDGSLDVAGLPEPPEPPTDPKPSQTRDPAPPSQTGDPAPPPGPTPGPTRDRTGETFNCEELRKIGDGRCGLYEALPSVLLAMNALPGYDDRLSAARDANGGWALVEGSSGEWEAASATRPGVAYDLSHYGVRAGVEFVAGEGLRAGVSAHHRRAAADVEAGGDIVLSGSGAGVNATFSQDGFYADAQAAVTWFDAEITSPRIVSESDGDGVSYAAALEAGKRVDVSDALAVTPRAALEWSDASLDAFTDSGLGGSNKTVSVESASALTGRVGVRVEAAPSGAEGVRLFGAIDVTHLLSQEAEARILNRSLKTTSEETGLRVALGVLRSWGEGLSLRGAAYYAANGGGAAGFGGTLSFAMRF